MTGVEGDEQVRGQKLVVEADGIADGQPGVVPQQVPGLDHPAGGITGAAASDLAREPLPKLTLERPFDPERLRRRSPRPACRGSS